MHARVSRAIKNARGARSAQWLADQTAALGYPISRAQIANYESGRKKNLDLAELVIIAAALQVPAAALLYPDLPDGEVEVLPGQSVSSIVAMFRFTGERDTSPESDSAKLFKLSRELFDMRVKHQVRLAFLDELVADIPEGTTNERITAAADRITEIIGKADEIRELEGRIREIQGSVINGHA